MIELKPYWKPNGFDLRRILENSCIIKHVCAFHELMVISYVSKAEFNNLPAT